MVSVSAGSFAQYADDRLRALGARLAGGNANLHQLREAKSERFEAAARELAPVGAAARR